MKNFFQFYIASSKHDKAGRIQQTSKNEKMLKYTHESDTKTSH